MRAERRYNDEIAWLSITAECPPGSVLTGGYSSYLGGWDARQEFSTGTGFTVGGAPAFFPIYFAANAICLRFV